MNRPWTKRYAAIALAVVLVAVAAFIGIIEKASVDADAIGVPDITYTYEVRGLGNASDLGPFAAAAAETYADGRGWSLGGTIAFRQVPAGGDFTLWLSAAGNLPGFGSGCSAAWSCRVGRNVIVNESRWLGASDAWNAAAGSLRDYRHMVINHETGHWLGFGHSNCGGAGQPAPVMQQQSISLQGCRFNPWPLDWEREQVARARGVAVRIGTPIGALDSAVPGFRAVQVQGWVIDPDTVAPAQVVVFVDGVAAAFPAGSLREDVAAAFPGYGAAHGFDVTVPAAPGVRNVCAFGINVVGTGVNVPLGCRTVVVGSPIGVLERVRTGPATVSVEGWALDPDTPASIPVHVYVDGLGTASSASGNRPDIAAFFAGFGAAHGFSVSVPAAPGVHQVCVWGIESAGIGGNSSLGCRTVTVGGSPVGSLDVVRTGLGSVQVEGWALDRDTASSIPVHVYVDGLGTASSASGNRPDIAAAYPEYGAAHGFSVSVPAAPGVHQVCVWGIESAGIGGNSSLGCRTVTVGGSPVGSLDVVRTGLGSVQVEGWALDRDTASSIPVHVYVDGLGTASSASGNRPDIAAAYPEYGAAHGFSVSVPAAPGVHQVCVWGIESAGIGGNSSLGCRTVTVGGSPVGNLDTMAVGSGVVSVAGWALDLDTASSIPVHVYVDGVGTAVVAAA